MRVGFEFDRFSHFTSQSPDVANWDDPWVRLKTIRVEADRARAGRDAWMNGQAPFDALRGTPKAGLADALYYLEDPERPEKIALARAIVAAHDLAKSGAVSGLGGSDVTGAFPGTAWTRVLQYASVACPFGHALEGFAAFLIADEMMTEADFIADFDAASPTRRMEALLDLLTLFNETEAGRTYLEGLEATADATTKADLLLHPDRMAGLLTLFDFDETAPDLAFVARIADERTVKFAAAAGEQTVKLYLQYAGSLTAVPDTTDLASPGPILAAFEDRQVRWGALRGLAHSNKATSLGHAFVMTLGAMKSRTAATKLSLDGGLTNIERDKLILDMLSGMADAAGAAQAIMESYGTALDPNAGPANGRLARFASIAGKTTVRGAVSVFGIVMGSIDTYRAFAQIGASGQNMGLDVGLAIKGVGGVALVTSSILGLLAIKFAAAGPPGWIAFLVGFGLTVVGELVITAYTASILEDRIAGVLSNCALAPVTQKVRHDRINGGGTNPQVAHHGHGFLTKVAGEYREDWARQIGSVRGLLQGIGFSMKDGTTHVELDSVRKTAAAYAPPQAIVTARPTDANGDPLPDSYFLPPGTEVTFYDVSPTQPDAHLFNGTHGQGDPGSFAPIEIEGLPSGDRDFCSIQGIIERPTGSRVPIAQGRGEFPTAIECRTTTTTPLLATSPLAALFDGFLRGKVPEMLVFIERDMARSGP